MTNETIKTLLMVMPLSGLVGATYVPGTWKRTTFVVPAIAAVWSYGIAGSGIAAFFQKHMRSSASDA